MNDKVVSENAEDRVGQRIRDLKNRALRAEKDACSSDSDAMRRGQLADPLPKLIDDYEAMMKELADLCLEQLRLDRKRAFHMSKNRHSQWSNYAKSRVREIHDFCWNRLPSLVDGLCFQPQVGVRVQNELLDRLGHIINDMDIEMRDMPTQAVYEVRDKLINWANLAAGAVLGAVGHYVLSRVLGS